jgi:hypothetical protein
MEIEAGTHIAGTGSIPGHWVWGIFVAKTGTETEFAPTTVVPFVRIIQPVLHSGIKGEHESSPYINLFIS